MPFYLAQIQDETHFYLAVNEVILKKLNPIVSQSVRKQLASFEKKNKLYYSM